MAQNKQKQNQKPLVMRILATALFMAVFSQFGQAQNVKLNGKGTTAEELVYTLNGTITGGSNGYATESDITQNDKSWKVMGNTMMNPWRIGGNRINNVARPIYSTSSFSDNISKIVVTHGAASSITVNSMTLTVSANSDFSNPTSTITGTFTANGTTTFNRPSGVDWSNKYFRIVYTVTVSGGTNRYLQFSKAEFYKETSATPSITASDANITYDATSGSIPVTIANPVTGGTLSATSSESWLTIGTVTTTSVPFTCTTNPESTTRSATVTITYTYSAKASVTQTVTVIQAGNPGAGCDDYEDFENVSGASTGYSAAGTLPTGWHRIYNNTVYDATVTTTPYEMPHVHHGSSYPGPGSGTNALSGNYLGFYGTGNGSICYAIMPALQANEAANHISFKYRYESTSNGTLSYGVIDGTDASTYNQLGICSNSNNNGLVDVDLDITKTTGKRIAFCWEYNGSSWYTAGIDNICVMTETVSNCPTPTDLNATNLTPNSATLSWTGEADSYNVQYRKAPHSELLFSEGFENGIPSTWSTIDGDGDGNNWMALSEISTVYSSYTGTMSSWAHSESNAATSPSYANGVGCMNSNQWLISPQVPLQGTLKFYAASTYSDLDAYEVLLSTTGTSISDFTTTLQAMKNAPYALNDGTDDWEEVTIDLSSYSGQGYIAIHHVSNCMYFLVVDDFSIYEFVSEGWTPAFAENGATSIDITGLDSDTEYEFQVQADCGSEGESGWSASTTFTTLDGCAVPTDLNATNITASNATLSWTGFTDTYNIQYREYNPTAPATIILNVPSDIWGDGSGYQMLLDADATAIDNNSISDYSIFEYLIPTNATYDPNTSGFVINTSVTIQIPAGTYDWFITNPSPDYDNVYVAASNGNVGGRQNNYVFEAGMTYEFVPSLYGNYDGVDVTITDNGSAWIPVNGITNPYPLQNLNPQTTYQYQIQGVNCDGNGHNTDWSTNAYFTTLNGFSITATTDPAGSGTFAFTGSGVISSDATAATVNPNGDVTITATAATGYTFMNWAEGGSVVSTSNAYTITAVDASHNLTAHFVDMTASNTWPAAVTSLAAATPGYSESGNNITISNANGLAWLISTVNGLNGQSAAFSDKTITLTADVDMSAHIWVPIGTIERPFTCTFEGNGHVITGVTRSTEFPHNGLFGYVSDAANIQNVVVQVELTGNSITTGAVAGTFASTGTISNVEGAGTLTGGTLTSSMGGLVGNKTGGTIHSSFAVNTITSANATTHVGGLVGNNIGNLYNSYANTTISGSGQIGGLAGKNNGTIENCYAVVGSQSFPAFAYENAEGGTIQYCYADNANGYVNTTAGGTPTPVLRGHGTYGTVKDRKAIGYMYDDNAVTLVAGNNSYVSSALAYNAASTQIEKWPGMLSALNQWVKSHSGYTPWFRPTSSNINGDLPVLGFTSDNCLGTIDADGKYLAYGSIANGANGLDDLLFVFNNNMGDAASSLFLYGSATAVTRVPESQVKTFVNEDAALIQANGAGDFTNVTVGITFDNSYKTGASDYFGTPLEYDWHFLSSPLQAAPMGMTYGAGTGYGTPASVNGMTGNYLPNGLVGQSTVKWDIYSFFEPQYHWINLKRTTGDHWHFEEPHDLIDAYTNESTFLQGKGYMMAISQDSYLSSTGTLNNGNSPITVNLTSTPYEDPHVTETGCNLLGNPYQAYLDMNDFFTTNNTLGATYWVYVAEGDNFMAGNCSASTNYAIPSVTLHPHQAFFVKTPTDGIKATFNYDMATDQPNGYSYFRGKIDYPLVNLFATNEAGKKDLAVIEVNRPVLDGSPKLRTMNNANFELYTRMNSQDYSILFTEEGTERVTLCFKAKENGNYTLSWDTQNGEFAYLWLIDNITGDKYDMLTTDHYTFEAKDTDIATRFYVEFRTKGGDTPVNSDSFAYFNGNAWVVQGQGLLELVDLMGHKLYSNYLAGESSEVHFGHLAAGTYMICLVSKDNKVKTQKIVIKN